MSENNHWSAQIASEEETKITFAPLAETICGSVTKAYLQPILRSEGLSPVGPNGGKLIFWYDLSELAARPDKSAPAREAFDRFAIGPTAYRREIGMDESDAPSTAELRQMIWLKAAGTVELIATAVAEVTGQGPTMGAVDAQGDGDSSGASPAAAPVVGDGPVTGPPQTRDSPRPEATQMPVTSSAVMRRLNGKQHVTARR
jgi:hypothetical protein